MTLCLRLPKRGTVWYYRHMVWYYSVVWYYAPPPPRDDGV